MKRIIGFLSLATLMAFFAVEGYAQVREKDKVERRDKKGNTVTVTGQIVDESPAGIKVRFEGKAKEEVIPVGDIQRVIYGDFTVNVLKSVAGSNQAERDRNFPVLVKTYEDIQAMPDLRTASAQSRRYIDYRLAQTRAGAAETDEQVKAAIKGLQDFIATNANSWEYPHAARQLGRLQADVGDFAGAGRTFDALEKTSGLPTDIKLEATAALIDITFQAGDTAGVKDKVGKILADANAPSALKDRAAMYQLALDSAGGELAATVKKIEDTIAKTQDPGLRALGYNVLGDVYFTKNQKRDAMWSYLWVDQVYNQDRGEHLKAMTRLIKIFEGESDADKVKMYRDKINRSR